MTNQFTNTVVKQEPTNQSNGCSMKVILTLTSLEEVVIELETHRGEKVGECILTDSDRPFETEELLFNDPNTKLLFFRQSGKGSFKVEIKSKVYKDGVVTERYLVAENKTHTGKCDKYPSLAELDQMPPHVGKSTPLSTMTAPRLGNILEEFSKRNDNVISDVLHHFSIRRKEDMTPEEIKHRLHVFNLTNNWSVFNDVPEHLQVNCSYPHRMKRLGMTIEEWEKDLEDVFGPLTDEWKEKLPGLMNK